MIFGVSYYFILMNFFIFSICGWIYESTFVSIRTGKPVNRGFLVGPMLPLYGTGATLVYLILRPVSHIPSLLYAAGMLVATILEYITSYLLEKIFHAKWWDYTKDPYNLNGRIALIPSLFWGFLSLLLFDTLEPLAMKLIDAIPYKTGVILLHVLIVVSCIDLVYTIITTINFRKQLENFYNFRNELEKQLEDIPFTSLRDIISSTSNSFSEKMEATIQKLSSLKENVAEDPRITALEEKFKTYTEKYTIFTKKNKFFGNRRIMDAFPTMKFISKNHSAIDVKELISNFNIKGKIKKDQ